MKEQLKAHEAKMQKTLDVLAKELAAVRAGRANPAVLDNRRVLRRTDSAQPGRGDLDP